MNYDSFRDGRTVEIKTAYFGSTIYQVYLGCKSSDVLWDIYRFNISYRDVLTQILTATVAVVVPCSRLGWEGTHGCLMKTTADYKQSQHHIFTVFSIACAAWRSVCRKCAKCIVQKVTQLNDGSWLAVRAFLSAMLSARCDRWTAKNHHSPKFS